MGNFIFGGGSKSLNKGGLLTCRGSQALPLSFALQPQAKTVDEYSLATFSCEVAGGTAPYAYQWKKNGTNVGANSANLSFTASAADNSASITVVVTDSDGAVITSSPAVLIVVAYQTNRNVLEFNGTSDYATISGLPTLSSVDNWYVSADLFLASTSGNRYFLTLSSLSDTDPIVGFASVSTTKVLCYHRDNSGSVKLNQQVDLDLSYSHSFTVRHRSGFVEYLIDGTLVATSTASMSNTTVSLYGLGALNRGAISGQSKAYYLSVDFNNIAKYALDEGSGATMIDSKGGYNGVYSVNSGSWYNYTYTTASKIYSGNGKRFKHYPQLNYETNGKPVYESYQLLPSASGGATQGFTCTGMTINNLNQLVVVNDGRATDGDSTYEPSIVITSSDGSVKVNELPVNPSRKSLQGVAIDPTTNNYYVAAPLLDSIIVISSTGTEINSFAVEIKPNGVAFYNGGLIVCSEGGDLIKLDLFGAKQRLYSSFFIDIVDQMFVNNNKLYVTSGVNGQNGKIEIYNLSDMSLVGVWGGLVNSQAIEGCVINANSLYVANDGGFHSEATPPNNIITKYQITSV